MQIKPPQSAIVEQPKHTELSRNSLEFHTIAKEQTDNLESTPPTSNDQVALHLNQIADIKERRNNEFPTTDIQYIKV